MKLKWVINSVVMMLLCWVTIISLAHRDAAIAAEGGSDKIEGLLLEQFATAGSADFIVRFTGQADLSSAYSMNWEGRGEFVYDALRNTATKSQVNAKAILDAAGLKYRTFIGGNDLYVWSGTLANTNALAALPEVFSIRATRTYSIEPIENTKPFQNIAWAGDLLAYNVLSTVNNSTNASVDWGIIDTKANQFWAAYGVKGIGIKVANIDTGVQWNHPALVNQFACPGDPTNPTCWDDPSNICGFSGACDNVGHGTHTMGTIVAKDNPALPYIAGMAPDATWIACKGCESTSCSDFALQSCFDWILAPGGDPAKRPNVVNNSWGGGQGDTTYQPYIIAAENAGIFVAFSAGNNGPGCGTVNSPGDLQVAFASAAHDSSRIIASFSSRGPSVFGYDPYTKPNISAPGVSICSSVPTNSWSCGYSGTSMASPHTAGAVALLWSCNPSLIGQIDATFRLLQNNTDVAPVGYCGYPPTRKGDYTYGYGYLNVLAAGVSACSGVAAGTLEGHVFGMDGSPINNAIVSTDIRSVVTDPTGFYSLTLPVGAYNVTASKASYDSKIVNGVVITEAATTTQDFNLIYHGAWTQIALPPGCPDWTRYDGEYYTGTGNVYFLGGRSGTSTDGTIYLYNPMTNTCTDTGVEMRTPISNYTINLVNNGTKDLLCTFGGRDSFGTATLNVQCYDPNANEVSIVTQLPPAWTGYVPGAQVVVNNKVYIFGGFNSAASSMTARTDQYDPVANSFHQMGDLSLARSYIMAASVDGIIYAFGGDTWNSVSLNLIAQTRAEKMNPADGIWVDAAVLDLPIASGEGRAYGFDSNSSHMLAGKIIIAGGGQFPADTNEVFTYNVSTDIYDYGFPDLNITRRDQAGFIIPFPRSTMWVFGGNTGSSDSPPYAPPEFFRISSLENYLPTINK
jgi:subtilisin family serine protease